MFPMVLAYERKGAMPAGRLITCAMILGLLFAGGPPVRAESNLTLPTPRSHYETFNTGNLRASFITEPAARSRSADSENGADVSCVFPFAEWGVDG